MVKKITHTRHVSHIELWSNRVTQWIGTPNSIILHSLFFVGIFGLNLFGIDLNSILLILTTAVSLEAIYLSIFIQMTVNRNTTSLQGVAEDIDEIQEDIDDLEENVDELQEDVEDIQEEDDEEGKTKVALENIETGLQKLIDDIETLKKQRAVIHKP